MKTCVVRAVYLDLFPELSTPAFLRSLKFFVARRGYPQRMLSDNGKTFEAADRVVWEVKWDFNIPKTPWWRGVFERMFLSTWSLAKGSRPFRPRLQRVRSNSWHPHLSNETSQPHHQPILREMEERVSGGAERGTQATWQKLKWTQGVRWWHRNHPQWSSAKRYLESQQSGGATSWQGWCSQSSSPEEGRRAKRLRRPVQKLYSLDIPS